MIQDPPIGQWQNATVYHGTHSGSVESIAKEIRIPATGGYFGNAFYTAADNKSAHMTWAPDAVAEHGGAPVVLAFKIAPSANILDMRIEKDAAAWCAASNKKYMGAPDWAAFMVSKGIDGIFDRSTMGVAVFNSSVIEILGTTDQKGMITPLPDIEHPALRHATKIAKERFHLDSELHGFDHWERVERNGAYLASKSKADPLVVALFARLHDCCRDDDHYDEEHGPKASRLFLADKTFKNCLTPTQIRKTAEALRIHTEAHGGNPDPTIGACWDSDRLDFVRLGCDVDTRYLSTQAAIDVAENYSADEIMEGRFCQEMSLSGKSGNSPKRVSHQNLTV